MVFDISIAIDKSKYLDAQIYLLVDTLKNNLPDETIVHVTTNRSRKSHVIKHIKENLPTKIYIKPKTHDLVSRCRYLLNAVGVKTDADYLVRMDVDILALKNLEWITERIKSGSDIYIQNENRRIIKNDNLETRLWRMMYRDMKIKMPERKMNYIEDDEEGRPLLNTGFMIIKSDKLPIIRERWKPLTKICEKYISLNVHPNEFSMSALIADENWGCEMLSNEDVFNPISRFRKGNFPSTELIDDCILFKDIKMLHWHHPNWLMHLSKYNKNIGDIICKNDKYIPNDWWNDNSKSFIEQQEM